MKRRIFISIFSVALCSVIITTLSITGVVYRKLEQEQKIYLSELEQIVTEEEISYLEENPILQKSNLLEVLKQSVPHFILICVALFILTGIISSKITNVIIKPVNQIDLEHPLETNAYEEFIPLLRRMNTQQEELNLQITQIEAQKNETNVLLSKMEEGLILLSGDSTILAVNESALQLLGAPPKDYIGKNLYLLTRNNRLHKSVAKAFQGDSKEKILHLQGKEIQLHTSPIVQQDEVEGVLCLLLDVTEKRQREQMRREFSANVSHELRTPLTSISGYAELLQNGIVKPEDVPIFAQRIYVESQSLVALIEDIMKISQLDEREENDILTLQKVDLIEISQSVYDRLAPLAQKKGLGFELKGTSAVIQGAPQILQEILYNLCENSIKYSQAGTITLSVWEEGDEVVLQVQDEGIGISAEHQPFVFERFYREDKSHSKETGGTGLGLSIVKHGVRVHQGSINLTSVKDEGTTITIHFPKALQI